METRPLGSLWPVSVLSLGGGGIGGLWGETSHREAVLTVCAAVDAGLTLIDVAPAYGKGEAEHVVGAAFGGKLPDGVRVTTKCNLGSPARHEILPKLERSLTRSLESMKLDRIDLFFLHSNICPDDYSYAHESATQKNWATKWSLYVEVVIPAFELLKRKGLIGAWGITGTGLPKTIMEALRHDVKPAAVQVTANLLDSPGSMRLYEEPPEPRNILRTAQNNGVGAMGIRAVQAGALTAALDRPLPDQHPERLDYEKAAPFRALAAELGEDPAVLAHRYALALPGVDTVVLGVKNRGELDAIVAGVAKGALDADIIARIDDLGLARRRPQMPIG